MMNTTTKNMIFNKGIGEIKFTLAQLQQVKHVATAGAEHFTLAENIESFKKGGKTYYFYGKRTTVRTDDSTFNDVIEDWHSTHLLLGCEKTGIKDVPVSNFSSKIIMLKLDKALAKVLAELNCPIFHNEYNGKMYRKIGKVYKDIVTGEIVDSLGEGFKRYLPLAYTTGSAKKSKMLFFRKDKATESWLSIVEKVLPGFKAELLSRAEAVVIAGGAYRPGADKVQYEHLITREDFAKIFSRISLAYTSGGRVTDDIGAIGYYHGVFDENSGMSDGAAVIKQSRIEELLQLCEEQGIGLQLQPRMRDGILKSACVVSPDEMFEEKLRELMATGKLEILGTGPVNVLVDKNNVKLNTTRAKNDMKILSIGKATKGKASKQLWQKVVFAASKKGMLIPLLEYMVERGSEELMELIMSIFKRIAKRAKLGSRYSMDLIGQEDPDNITLLSSLISETLDAAVKLMNKLSFGLPFADGSPSIYNGVVTPDLTTLMTSKQCSLGKDENGKHEVYFGKISKMIGKLKKKAASFRNRIAESKKNGFEAADYAKDLVKLDKEIAELEKKYHDCKIIKYPTVFIGEYLDAVLVDSYELEQRILANDKISAVYKRGLIRMITHGSDSMIMFESDKKVYGLLAGMDNDYDKCGIIFDKFINEILDGNQFAEITLVQKNSSKSKKMSLEDMTLPLQMFADQNDPYNSVGGITNQADKGNNAQSGLYANLSITALKKATKKEKRDEKFEANLKFLEELRDSSFDVSVNILRESVGETEGVKDAYKVQLSDYIDENNNIIKAKAVDIDFSIRMAEEIRRVEWTKENVRAFLFDLSMIYRLYQEGIIDAAKTGIHLNRIFNARSVILESNIALASEREKDGTYKVSRGSYAYLSAGDIVTVKDESGSVVDEIATIQYHDFLSEVQDRLVTYFNEEFNKKIAENKEDFKYSREDIEAFRKAKDEADLEDESVFADLINAKKTYNSLAASKMVDLNDVEDDDDDEEIVQINAEYSKLYATLFNTVKDTLKRVKLSDRKKGALLLGASCYTSDGEFDAYRTNKFAYTVAPSYTFKYLFKGSKVPTFAEPVVDNIELEDGIKLDFINGVDAANKVVIADKYTGEADYHVDSEKYSYVQVNVPVNEIGQLANTEKSDELMIVINGSNKNEQYLLDKFEMIDTSVDNELVFEKGKLKTSNDQNGWDVVNADGKPLFLNTMKERTYYTVTSSRCVYTKNYYTKVNKLTYVILTVKED